MTSKMTMKRVKRSTRRTSQTSTESKGHPSQSARLPELVLPVVDPRTIKLAVGVAVAVVAVRVPAAGAATNQAVAAKVVAKLNARAPQSSGIFVVRMREIYKSGI